MDNTHASSSYHASFGPTGFRRGFCEEDITPLEAPIRPRQYLLPSKTTRRDLNDGLQDELSPPPSFDSPPPPDPLESSDTSLTGLQSRIQEQRLKNTLSARRSRARKLETLENLRREKVELEQALRTKEAALARALEESSYFRALIGNLQDQLAQKSDAVVELTEMKERLSREVEESRIERHHLLGQLTHSGCSDKVCVKIEATDEGGTAL